MKKEDKLDFFTRFTSGTSARLGKPWTFAAAMGVILLWLLSGPMLGFSHTWLLIINTGATVTTFLMVFIIQNTQIRDSMAMNIKLDTLLEKSGIKEKTLIGAEDQSAEELLIQKKRIHKKNRRSR